MKTISNDDYFQLIPSKTAEFVRNLVKSLADENTMSVYGSYVNEDAHKIFYKLLYELHIDKRYSGLFGGFGISFSEINGVYHTDYKTHVFNSCSKLFKICEQEEDYKVLNPLVIAYNFIESLDKKTREELFAEISDSSLDLLIEYLKKEAANEIKEDVKNILVDYFKNVKIEVVSYLETVGKIYIYFRNNKDKIKNYDEDYMTTMSYLSALFVYDDVNKEFNAKKIMNEYLDSIGLTQKNIENVLGIEVKKEYLLDIDPTLVLSRFFEDAKKVANCSVDKVTVDRIVEKLTNSESNLNIYLLKFLNLCGVDDDEISNMLKKVKEERENVSSTTVEDFYNDLIPEVIEFLNYTMRIYSYLLSFYKDNKLDGVILQNENDLVSLAMFIASYQYKGYVSEFFIDHGVTLEYLEKILNINLDIKEIEKVKFDEKAIINKYNKFLKVYASSKTRSSIRVSDLLSILTYDYQTNSKVLQRIFSIKTKKTLKDTFGDQIKTFNKDKAKKEEIAFKYVFFYDLSSSVYDYLTHVSLFFENLMGFGRDFNKKDMEVLALLFAVFKINSNLTKYLETIGITRSKVEKFFSINKSFYDKNLNINLLDKYFRDFVFGGYNKDKKRTEITVESIFANAFNKELNDSFEISRFLDELHLSSEFFANLEIKLMNYEEDLKKKEINNVVESLNKENDKLLPLFENVVRVYEYLNNVRSTLKFVYEDKDLEEISLLIAFLLTDSSYISLFSHNGITLEVILNKININKNVIEDVVKDISIIEPDLELLVTNFKKYINKLQLGSGSKTIEDVIKKIFDNSINNSQILETITAKVGSRYDYLQEEILSGKEREVELSREDRIILLEKEKTPIIDTDDITSMMLYGDTLSKHSNIISDELKDIALSDTTDKSLSDINDLIGQLYVYESSEIRKNGFFDKLFKKENDVTSKKNVNPTILSSLKNSINENIEKLNKELIGYDYLRKYIELYLKIINDYYEEVYKKNVEAKANLATLSVDKEEDYSEFLKYSTIVQILSDKVHRFETSKILMKQELLKVHQVIVNHFITINALKTSRDDLIPLIGSEISINIGKATENNALDLSNNLISLFHSILDKNVIATRENLELLRDSSLPESTINKISDDINSYLNMVRPIEESIEKKEDVVTLNKKYEGE